MRLANLNFVYYINNKAVTVDFRTDYNLILHMKKYIDVLK